MKRIFIDKKYENGKCYERYYDLGSDCTILIDEEDPDLEYIELNNDFSYINYLNEQKVKGTRQTKDAKKKITKSLLLTFGGILLSTGIYVASQNPHFNYSVKRFINNYDSISELNSEYIEEAISSNQTISDEVKELLIVFFNSEYIGISSKFDRNFITDMFMRLKSIDCSKISLSDEKEVIALLTNILGYEDQESIKYIAREFYEYYYGLEASYKTRMFDAINGNLTNSNTIAEIITKGDDAYIEFIQKKYLVTEERAREVLVFLRYVDSYMDQDICNTHINNILSLNYLENPDYLNQLSSYFNYHLLSEGNALYSANVFSGIIELTLTIEDYNFKTYYDTKTNTDITDSIYLDKYSKWMDSFDGDLDIKSREDRLLLYLYVLTKLASTSETEFKENIESMGINEYIYATSQSFLDYHLYSYLNKTNYDYTHLMELISSLLYRKDLEPDDITLLSVYMICLKQDVYVGLVDPELYEIIFKDMSDRLRKFLSEEELLEWQDIVYSDNIIDEIPGILNKYRKNSDKVINTLKP